MILVSIIGNPFLVMELIGIDNSSGVISEQMIRIVEHYPPESIVLVKGKIRQPPQPVQNATIHKNEILILEIHLVSQLCEHVPFTVYDAENIGKLAKKEDQEEEGESDEEEISAEEISTSSEDRQIKVPKSKSRGTINMTSLWMIR
jgi:aspartyl-tRNA synthetase